jgi:pimeloyl-ACP methyl ester carboxylesterase
MASRAKFGDLIIIVPGILGSRLVHNGVPLWGDARTFLQWVRAHAADVPHLTVGSDDPSLDDLGDGIVPDGLVDSLLVVGRFVKVGGYTALTRALEKSFTLKLGENLQLFSYDWRRDLRVATRRLATKAEGWLEAWRTRCGNRAAKIVLVGHAMGGLVARAFADIEGGWPSIRKIISIGTPFLGSIRALDLLYFGLDFRSYGLPLQDLTSMARTFTSVYELLPRYPAIRTFTGETISPFDIRIPTFEQQKMERARQFHRDLIDHHGRNRGVDGYAAMASQSIIGIGQPTIERARLLANGTLAIDRDAGDDQCDGDGTVPRFSAEAPAPTGFEGQWVYVPQSHGMLIADPTVHAHVVDSLRPGPSGTAPPATPLPRFTLRRAAGDSLRIDADSLFLTIAKPFYKVGQPIEITVGARSATGHPFDSRSTRIAVRVEQIAHLGKRAGAKVVRMHADSKRPGRWVGSYRAPVAGSYRVSAVASHRWLAPFRVCDFFEVDAGK